MEQIKKIVVFTGNLEHYSVRKGIISINKALEGLSWLIAIHAPRLPLRKILRRQWLNLKRNGWRRIPDVIHSSLSRLLLPSMAPVSSNYPGYEYSLFHIRSLPNVRIVQFQDIHSAEAEKAIRNFEPDLGLSLAAPILKPHIFSIPKLGTLNLHKGKLPDYRGMPPAFWELWNDESTIGCTVHWIDEHLDTGPIALSTTIDCEKYSTVRGMQLRLDEIGNELLKETVIKISKGVTLRSPQNPGGKTYRKPTLKQMALLNKKIQKRLPPRESTIKTLLKNGIRGTLFAFDRLGMHQMLPPRVTVLLYHRVSDNARDNLTVGIEQFERHMILLRRYFHVLSLPELLQMKVVPRFTKPAVCVTFDDGYLDNYLYAFPILKRYQIPATFFVSTGLIGTQRRFPHDIWRGNDFIPLMDWDCLAEMNEANYTIGSHTVNHINCAKENEDTVREELVESMEDIRSKLGIDKLIFSYPYGGKHDITREQVNIVKEVGYIGCVSAFGGTNSGKINPFDIRRCGIHWEFSDISFLYTALGL